MSENLLEVQNVTKVFGNNRAHRGGTVALDDVSLTVPLDKPLTITIAGESGSGKTTLAQTVLGFLVPTAGRILYKGADIRKMAGSCSADYRREIQAIFQNPFEAFNPFYTIDHVFNMVIKGFKLARNASEASEIVTDALNAVGLDSKQTLGRYPHQLSGGQLQRIMIARAFLMRPRIIVADEPVSMIDASLRVTVLDAMANLKSEYGISQLYITHDLSTALQISDEIVILYRGAVVERGDAESVIWNPQHPYTQLLVESIPVPDPEKRWEGSLELAIGAAQEVMEARCSFYNRCPRGMSECINEKPCLHPVGENHDAACHLYKGHESS